MKISKMQTNEMKADEVQTNEMQTNEMKADEVQTDEVQTEFKSINIKKLEAGDKITGVVLKDKYLGIDSITSFVGTVHKLNYDVFSGTVTPVKQDPRFGSDLIITIGKNTHDTRIPAEQLNVDYSNMSLYAVGDVNPEDMVRFLYRRLANKYKAMMDYCVSMGTE